jgi:hypothetical protein
MESAVLSLLGIVSEVIGAVATILYIWMEYLLVKRDKGLEGLLHNANYNLTSKRLDETGGFLEGNLWVFIFAGLGGFFTGVILFLLGAALGGVIVVGKGMWYLFTHMTMAQALISASIILGLFAIVAIKYALLQYRRRNKVK